MTPTRQAVVAGAFGLIGSTCLQELLESPRMERVIALVRRTLPAIHPKLEQVVTDFARPPALPPLPQGVFLCALGTTLRKAGSEAAFRRVDLEIPFELADAALRAGAKGLVVVSSVGADAGSPNFYLRVKGEMEEALRGLGYEAVDIFRPSLLLGEREENRPAERLARPLAKVLGGLLRGGLSRYRAVEAEAVARAMVAAAVRAEPGERWHYWRQIQELAGRRIAA